MYDRLRRPDLISSSETGDASDIQTANKFLQHKSSALPCPAQVVLYNSILLYRTTCPAPCTSLAGSFASFFTDKLSKLFVYPMHWIDPLISFFRLSVCLLTDRLSNDYVHNSLPIFTKFCVRLRNVVASSPIVCERNRK